ncbi:MAG: hypothetical protein HC892_01495 [Saprospiraceae bacterium]|nr:hypothetical protein [Saprospiraceae bacterium]
MIKETFKRLMSSTPLFFTKLRNISASISAAALSAAAFYPQMPLNFQELIPIEIVKYITVSGFVAAFVAQLTKKDVSDTNNVN